MIHHGMDQMSKHPLLQVDAFTDTPLYGNPCAVVFDADDLDAATMQAIAREMNLSETAFVRTSTVADVGARYFTPAEEIPMAGHPTIATVHALVEAGRLSLTGEVTRLTLELPAGVIPVEIHARMGHIETIVMTQLEPSFLSVHDPWEIMPAFSLEPTDLIAEAPIQTVSTGTPQLMIPLKDHDALRRARLQSGLYTALREAADFFSPHLFCLGGVAGGDTFARHFGVPPDTAEDPFTGSATGAMAAYLWHHALIEKVDFMAEQGHWMGRPGRAMVSRLGPADAIEGVRVAGAAVTVFRGELLV